ncbi:MAG: serine hydrolase [Pseudomonadota bacterium]
MRLLRYLLVLILIAAIAVGLWYFRPWSDYSPAKFASLDKPEKLTHNFTNMASLVPSSQVAASSKPQLLENAATPIDVLAIEYQFEGKTRPIADFIPEASVLGLMVLQGGQIKFESYFQDTNDETLYTSWSVAKSFVATVIAMAVEEGLIESLDDSVSQYAPQYEGSHYGEASLRALLAMSSGIEFDENYASNDSDIRPFFFDAFILRKDPDSLLTPYTRSRDEFTDFDYISPNSHVLSAVLRGVYKKPLADIIEEKIWQPLGMSSNANWLQHKPGEGGQGLGYCCLNATLKDYARFGLFHLDAQLGKGLGASILPQAWRESLMVPASEQHKRGGAKYAGRGYSSHFWLPPNDTGVFFAAGVYGQYIWIDPARDLVIVRTSSDPDWTPRFLESEAVFMAISAAIDNQNVITLRGKVGG